MIVQWHKISSSLFHGSTCSQNLSSETVSCGARSFKASRTVSGVSTRHKKPGIGFPVTGERVIKGPFSIVLVNAINFLIE